jgi:hypothetical protein
MRYCIYSAIAHALTVRIPDEDVTYFKTVGDAADYSARSTLWPIVDPDASAPARPKAGGAQPKERSRQEPGLTGPAPSVTTVWFNLMLEVGLVGQQGGSGSRRQVGECGVFTAVDPVFDATGDQFEVFLSVSFRSLIVSVGELA